MFDVLVQIYEAYGYSAREAVSSIVEHNIYGLDIDERAAQLAYFSVMMKARQYDWRFFSRGIQPHVYSILESNNLDPHCIEYFVDDRKELKAAMDKLLKELHDAKEYGSILNVTKVDFDALYARFEEIQNESVPGIYSYQAIDTLLPFVQVAHALAQKYYAVVTNPPYMGSTGMSVKLSKYVKENYEDSKSDLFAVFIERCKEMTRTNGYQGLITQPSLLFLSSFAPLRNKIINTSAIENLLHMGRGIFGVDFGSTSFILRKIRTSNFRGNYFRLHERNFQYIDPDDICKVFLLAKNNPKTNVIFSIYNTDTGITPEMVHENGIRVRYTTNQEYFENIPGAPFAYSVSDALLKTFSSDKIGSIGTAKVGIGTGNTERFLRLWYEVAFESISFSQNRDQISNLHYVPINKGGFFRKWYGNNEYVINWKNNGFEIINYSDEKGKKLSYPRNLEYQLLESLTWGDVSSGNFSMRFSPGGFFFSDVGNSLFIANKEHQLYVLGFCNTKVFNLYTKILNQTMHFKPGNMLQVPIIFGSQENTDRISALVQQNITLCKEDWDDFEVSWDFKAHPFIKSVGTLNDAYNNWKLETERRFNQLKNNEETLNFLINNIYDVSEELTPYVEDKDVTVRLFDLQRDVRGFISYAIGCIMGRYSLDVDGLIYAGGKWDASKYQTFIPDADAILPICDDEYFEDDIVGRFVKFVEVVYGKDTLEENLHFIADALGGKGSSRDVIRNYFINDFYTDHLKVYQKRPIYWLFDSGKKNGFKCLIYMHRYQPDTIARIRTDYVHEQQSRYRTAIADLEIRVSNARTGERVKLIKRLDSINAQAEELRVYEEKIHHLADQMIRIDLDDGVKVNYAKFQDVLAKIK